MEDMASSLASQLEADLASARAKVAPLEQALQASAEYPRRATDTTARGSTSRTTSSVQELSQQEYKRYGRQMILPAAHILVIGAGGLGCPVLLYLAAAGIGESSTIRQAEAASSRDLFCSNLCSWVIGQITILDHDDVELSNLHRQVLHDETRIGVNKAQSARKGLERMNSDIIINSHSLPFTPSLFDPSNRSSTPDSILEASFTLILDCTDNPSTRHFLNAYAVRYKIPLVSGGAVRAEGTVGVFGLALPDDGAPSEENEAVEYGPCYACVFPAPTSAFSDGNDFEGLSEEEKEDKRLERMALQGTGACSDEGVLGLLCGQVGVQMGCEAMRVLLGIAKPTLHLLSPLSSHPLRTIKLRARQPSCPACGSDSATKWDDFLRSGHWAEWIDPLCELPGAGQGALRKDEKRWGARALNERLREGKDREKLRLIDVRPSVEYGICKVPASENIPLTQILRDPSVVFRDQDGSKSKEVVFLCRRGNDSIVAARAVKRVLKNADSAEVFGGRQGTCTVGDLKHGLVGWSRDVDETFPLY
ncbi:BQ2448_7554 [Microbotryum intermedium]|uniref:BQ2448_7554 protein n=1 Tax=Microbotryum intermedium TaxID=269621 RepID=A0A238FMY3_9BASI|nr:BQ2448_7554 [Microbotryum intermedium]